MTDEKFLEILEKVKIALRGRGCFEINNRINKKISSLKERFGYDHQDFQDLALDFTMDIIQDRDSDSRNPEGGSIYSKYDDSRGGLQNYINWRVLGLLDRKIRESNRKIDLVNDSDINIDEYNKISFIENIASETHNQEDEIGYKQLIEVISKYMDEIDQKVLLNKISQTEAARMWGFSKQNYSNKYNIKLKKLQKHILYKLKLR